MDLLTLSKWCCFLHLIFRFSTSQIRQSIFSLWFSWVGHMLIPMIAHSSMFNRKQVETYKVAMAICDVIWENLSHVAKYETAK